MNRLLTCTAVGLFFGLTPALAQTEPPMDESQTPPAVQEPAQPSEPSEALPAEPSDPAAPIPGQSSELPPDDSAAPSQSSEMAPDEASPPSSQSSEIAPDEAAPSQSSEGPTPIIPDQSAAVSPASPQFLSKQEGSDWLASKLIGKSVVNANNESIGDINDLVTDENGKIVGVLIGAGGFLGLGEKDVALRFEDLKLARDEDNNLTVMADVSNETLASAPDYETLDEQEVTVGKTDREDMGQPGESNTY
jgi:sporulation protein YlmC with PRC-barrel domain